MNEFILSVLTAPIGKTHIFSVGQAGFIIKSSGGQLLGIDLYLSDCVERVEGNKGFKRLLPRLFYPFNLQFDYIIATHFHRDHFDLDSIPELMSNDKTRLFAALDCKDSVKQLEMSEERISYVSPGISVIAGDYEINFVSCDHGEGAPLAVGVIIRVDNKIVYETGDTCLRLDRASEYLEFGTPDILIAPINGEFGNMNEQECAELADALKARCTIPCHYGMFASHGGSPKKFYDIMTEQYPDNKFILMTQGERLSL